MSKKNDLEYFQGDVLGNNDNNINENINNNDINTTIDNNINNSINNDINNNLNDNNYENQNNEGFYNDFTPENEKKSISKKTLFIIGGIIILLIIVFIIFFFVQKNKKFEEYQNLLVEVGKEYYIVNEELLPSTSGECKTINLNTLINNNLIVDKTLTTKCDKEKTTIKVCRLQSGTYHYTPTLYCGKSYTTNYDEFQEGTEANLIKNRSDINFMYSIKETSLVEDLNMSKEEVFFEDEIPYEEKTYQIINEKTLYRSRDVVNNWYKLVNYYYPNDVTIESKVNEYYLEAPNAEYNNKGNSATVYKWIIGQNLAYENGKFTSYATYPYIVKGAEGDPIIWASDKAPEKESYRTISSDYIYRTRKLESTDIVTDVYYQCNNNNEEWINENKPCNETENIEGSINTTGYKCSYKNNVTGKTSTDENFHKEKCIDIHHYVNESNNDGYSNWTATKCDYNAGAKPYLCDRKKGYIIKDRVWKWYTPSERTYFTTKGIETYYKVAPSAQAFKDQKNEEIGFTWYKQVKKDLGSSKTAPTNDAIKGAQVFTKWSDWTETIINQKSDNQVEHKTQVTLKRIVNTTNTWNEISNGYISLEDAISLLKNKGYDVNSLDDISKLENIKYELKTYYRNPK